MEEPVDSEEASKENEQILANLSSAEEATSEDEVEIEKLLQAQKSRNTQYKTKSDLNAWTKICESLKESRAIVNIPAKEVDHLSHGSAPLPPPPEEFMLRVYYTNEKVG